MSNKLVVLMNAGTRLPQPGQVIFFDDVAGLGGRAREAVVGVVPWGVVTPQSAGTNPYVPKACR